MWLVKSTVNAGSMTCLSRSAKPPCRSQMRVKTGPTTSERSVMYWRRYGSSIVASVLERGAS